jgi:hypothetical protein
LFNPGSSQLAFFSNDFTFYPHSPPPCSSSSYRSHSQLLANIFTVETVPSSAVLGSTTSPSQYSPRYTSQISTQSSSLTTAVLHNSTKTKFLTTIIFTTPRSTSVITTPAIGSDGVLRRSNWNTNLIHSVYLPHFGSSLSFIWASMLEAIVAILISLIGIGWVWKRSKSKGLAKNDRTTNVEQKRTKPCDLKLLDPLSNKMVPR